MSRQLSLVTLYAALLIGGAPAFAAPNLYWDHLDGGAMSQADCVNKANAAMTAEKLSKITRSEDSVRSWSEQIMSTIECIKTDGKLMIMVLVGSNDATAGNVLFIALKKGMQP